MKTAIMPSEKKATTLMAKHNLLIVFRCKFFELIFPRTTFRCYHLMGLRLDAQQSPFKAAHHIVFKFIHYKKVQQNKLQQSNGHSGKAGENDIFVTLKKNVLSVLRKKTINSVSSIVTFVFNVITFSVAICMLCETMSDRFGTMDFGQNECFVQIE